MRHTFRKFLNTYDADTIQLIYGEHIVNIDERVDGSLHLMCVFLDREFDFVSYDENTNHLILKY